MHPYTITEDGKNWELLPSISLNQYKVCEGIMILAAPPNRAGGLPIYMREPQADQWTYAEVREEFEVPQLVMASDSESESEESDDEDDLTDIDPEDKWHVEKIVDHKADEKGVTKYRIRWRGYDHRSDSHKTEEQLEGCMELLEEYRLTLADGMPDTESMMITMAAIEEDMECMRANLVKAQTMVMQYEMQPPENQMLNQDQVCFMAGHDMLDDSRELTMGVTEIFRAK